LKPRFDGDLVLAELDSVGRAVAAVREIWPRTASGLEEWIVRDVAVLNLQRAAQALVDLAQHLLAENGWGLPSSSAESFDLLERRGVLPADLASLGRAIVGFRNIAVHEYRRLEPKVVEAIVVRHLPDLERLADAFRRATVAAS
jgi:uncharacterized protein YutE (UPF0331/DUF86 family)